MKTTDESNFSQFYYITKDQYFVEIWKINNIKITASQFHSVT